MSNEEEKENEEPDEDELIIEEDEESEDEFNIDYDLDAILATQAQQIMNEFQVELVDGIISRLKIYLDVSLTDHYIIGIDFSAYPGQRPLLTVQESVKKLIGDPNDALNTLKNWDPHNPPPVLNVIRELETILYEISLYKSQADIIAHEFKIEPAGDSRNHYIITLITYGWKEYKIEIYLASQFNPPVIKFSPELQQITGPPENFDKIKNWIPEYQVNDILRDIQWKIDQYERMNFEVDLLYGSLQNVKYDPNQRKVYANLKGVMNTNDMIFSFCVEIPNDYPMTRPVFSLTSEIQDDKIAETLSSTTEASLAVWDPFHYLIDVFNAISKSIFSASVLSCIICHKIECPTCGISLSTQDGSPACYYKCPYCGKPYHQHCWEQNIRAINKCAFCLRTPPQAALATPRPSEIETSDESSSDDQSTDNSNNNSDNNE
ncbi:MAG: hypothetical protein ACTSPY_15315 [Candidatus Helarchaeota archaeon]